MRPTPTIDDDIAALIARERQRTGETTREVTNRLLVVAAMPALQEHDTAGAWLTARYESPSELVGRSWSSLYAFARIVSFLRILGDAATTVPDAGTAALAFLDQDNARLIDAGPAHTSIASELVATPGVTCNDVADIRLAALAIEHGLTLCPTITASRGSHGCRGSTSSPRQSAGGCRPRRRWLCAGG